ncbi:MAG: hypothetical protein ABI699_09340 [Caldimonas sp.]
MSAAWSGPIATHGQTEDEVRAAFRELHASTLLDLRNDLARDRWPPAAIEKALVVVEQLLNKRVEDMLPTVMRDMAISAGAAALH